VVLWICFLNGRFNYLPFGRTSCGWVVLIDVLLYPVFHMAINRLYQRLWLSNLYFASLLALR